MGQSPSSPSAMAYESRSRAGLWPRACAAAFGVAWLASAWRPLYEQDWALENLLPLCAAWWLLRHHRRAPLSDTAYFLLLLLGAHFTYAEVPYDAWCRRFFNFSPDAALGLARNEYDRLVHFSFGLLCFRPMREALGASLPASRPAAALVLTGAVITAISALYELLEWAAALLFGGDLGMAYLGTQGDVWDAQKDMAVALLGTAIALAACLSASGLRTAGRRSSGPGASARQSVRP